MSVLPVIARLFRKLVFDQLSHHLDKMHYYHLINLILELSMQLLHLCLNVLNWYNGLDNGQMTRPIIIVLKKPFDTVDHEILSKNSTSSVFRAGVVHILRY